MCPIKALIYSFFEPESCAIFSSRSRCLQKLHINVARRLLLNCLFIRRLHKSSIFARSIHSRGYVGLQLNHLLPSPSPAINLPCWPNGKHHKGDVAMHSQLDFTIVHTLDYLINCLIQPSTESINNLSRSSHSMINPWLRWTERSCKAKSQSSCASAMSGFFFAN